MGRNRYSPEEQAFYKAYLNSPLWRLRKSARIIKAGGRCEWEVDDFTSNTRARCTRLRYLCVHHNTYERLGCERDSDLDVYCFFHHMLEHLLWKKCVMCKAPCLEDEIAGARWLVAFLASLGIDLDSGPVVWKNLPNKEYLLAYVPDYCPGCERFT